ncbi:hypothetical protein GCM10028808_07960 [Spirosoma migulaei]
MKLPAYSNYDSLLQVIVLPIYVSVLNWLLIGPAYWQNWVTFGLATGITLILSFSNWYVNNIISLKVLSLYPDPSEYMRRTIRMFVACASSSCVHVTLIYGIYYTIKLPYAGFSINQLGLAWLFTIILVGIVVITYESIHNFGHWQQSRREVDTLSKAQLQAQLDTLRQQVNPHFLFNSLNSLISLIGEDPRQAELFAEELSSVYRYLLRSNESGLTSLASELEFIQSYYHLLKTRHGEALILDICIHAGTETRQLPPLTLQLLIENAVKHNIILPDQPLTISLKTTDHQLVVSNNLQRKPSRTFSNGIGLNNILAKYQMLGQPAPVVEDDGLEFRVTLQLV